MDKKRAKEIATSPVMVNVTYNNKRIFIDSVDENKGTATIHPLMQHENKQEVSLNSLREE